MPDVNLAPYDARQQALQRRRQLALALQQQGMEPLQAPPVAGAKISPLEGFAKLAQVLGGKYQNAKLDKQQEQLNSTLQAERDAKMQQLAQALGVNPQLAGALGAQDPALQAVGQVGLQDELTTRRQKAAQEAELAQALARPRNIDPLSPEGIAAQQQLKTPPTPRNIDPLSPEGIAAQLQLKQTQAPSLSHTNVMVDGKPAVVLTDNQGNFLDLQTKKPITGRITPYVTPPAPRQRGEITPTAEAGLVQSLNKQWQTASKDVQDVYRANTIMDAGLEAARRGDMNAGSQAILVTFQKFLDPTSVVRESEYARSGAGLAMAERIRGYIDKLERGGAGVTLPELEKFAQLGKEINQRLSAEGKSLLSAEKNRITGIANRYNVPPELVIPQYDYAQPGGTTAPGTATPAPASTGGWSVKVKK